MDEKTKALLAKVKEVLKTQNKPVDSHEVSIQLKEPKSTQTLIEEVRDTKTGIKGFLEDILAAIRAIKVKPADVNIHTPKEVEIKKPSWISEAFSFNRIHNALENIEEALKREKPDPKIDWPQDPANPVPVRLSDGSKFIEQLTQQIVQTTSGVSIPKVTATDVSGNVIAVPVVNPDGSNISGGSGGAAAYSNGAGTTKQGLVDADRHVQVDVLTMPAVSIDTTGLALEAKQDTQITHLAAIEAAVEGTIAVSNAGLTELAAAINASSQVDVNIAAGNITGFATSAKQDTIIGHVDGIEGLLAGTLAVNTELPAAAALADSTANPTVPGVGAYLLGWNGTTWDRVQAYYSDAESLATLTGLATVSQNRIFDGANWDRMPGNSTDGVLVNLGANNDITYSVLDKDTTTNTNHAQKYYTSAGAATDGIIWSPAAGKRWHITTLYINVSAAATVTLEDDLAGGDSVVWKGELAANSGVVLTYDRDHPFASTEDAADLIITTTAGNVYVQAVGYEI
jgi:hypothetical protein